MAVDYELNSEDVEIFNNETFTREIHRLDGAAFATNDTGTFEIREYLTKAELSNGTMTKDATESLFFEVNVSETHVADWELGRKYELLCRVLNSDANSNDVLYQVVFTVI